MSRIEDIVDANFKRQKGLEDGQEDRISSLPDSILLHILSFLSIKDVVKTVLLRRFGNLWKSVHTLNFDARSNLNFSKGCHSKWFTEFVAHILLHHDCPTIFKFSLKFGSYLYFSPKSCKPHQKKSLEPSLVSRVDSWIYFALQKKVKVLDLAILAHDSSSARFDYDLPTIVFTSHSMTELNLVNIGLRQPEQVSMKSLKMFSLTTIELNDKIIERILSGCPLLESLSLIQCCGFNKLNCTSAYLTNLMIVLGDELASLEISGPNLLSLSISGLNGQVDLRNLSSLFEATLDFCFRITSQAYDYCHIASLLEGLHQANTFTISSWCILILIMWEKDNIPCTSSTRKHLVLKTKITKRHLPGIARLLRSSPHLEMLTVQIGDDSSSVVPDEDLYVGISGICEPSYWKDDNWLNSFDINMEQYFELEPPFGCLKNHLKIIRIRGGSLPNSPLLQLLKFLLGNSFVLERMEISMTRSYPYSHSSAADVLELAKLLSTYPKASPNAIIAMT